ncbi:hypothetical protein C0Z18_12360 [Trinickia dabaoshanensis]|uniref:Surface-adhesin protein E-like domain-containing protein n=1 Tax=Trinickia dabaoshanensis TaxID=564714 RepID=A0A2N7VR61_9BURK|nr:hypothetical protein C0Z18_12360 [Trinickia dabaoshanensis]
MAATRQRRGLFLATILFITAIDAIAQPAWVRVAASPDVQVFVDAGSLKKDAHGLISVWTKTLYSSPQTDVEVHYTADMTLFVLDCKNARYGIAGGKFLDASGKVLSQFGGSVGKLEPILGSSKIDAVSRAVCGAESDNR